MNVFYGSAGSEVLNGSEADDSLYGYEGNDTLIGGPGNDLLVGGAGSDIYRFGYNLVEGNDTILGDGLDLLNFADGFTMDKLDFSRSGNDLVLSTPAGDSIAFLDWSNLSTDHIEHFGFGNLGSERPNYGALTDISMQTMIESNDSERVFVSSSVDLRLYLLGGEDSIWAVGANFFIDGGSGDDTLISDAGADTLSGMAGDDYLIGGSGDDLLIDDAGNNTLDGGAGNDVLELSGTGTSGILLGGDGQDLLLAYEGTIATLLGGKGNDTYYVSVDSSTIVNNSVEYSWEENGNDTIVFSGALVSPDRFNYRRNGNDVVVSFEDREFLTLKDWVASSINRVEHFVFTDGSVLSGADVTFLSLPLLGGATSENDLLTGTTSAERIEGLDGNDLLQGIDGDDWLDGGDGTDTILGGLGADTLVGGDGDDSLRGDDDSNTGDTLFGGEGNDTLIGGWSDQLFGEAGNDWIELYVGSVDGGAGNDTLTGYNGKMTGGEGSDLYLIGSYLFGTTIIDDFAANDTGIDWAEILFAKEDFVFSQAGNDLMLSRMQDSTQRIRFANWFLGSEYQVDTVSFSGDVALSAAEMTACAASATSIATTGNDTSTGTESAERIEGLGGNDLLQGMDGDDWLDGGDGADTILGGLGADTLVGGDGDDFLRGDDDSITGDTLFGGEGNDTLIGGANDKAYGDAGNDYLELYAWGQVEGGVGNDTLTGYWGTMTGGEGSDLYLIGSYLFGTTIIDDFAANDTGVDRAEISFAKEEFVVTLDGNDLVLSRIQDSSQQIHFANLFLGSEYQVDTVSFSGNVTLNAAELTALVTPTYLNATSGDDVLLGTARADLVNGLGGNDLLQGMDGDDWLDGGDGADTILGGLGADTLVGGDGDDSLRGNDDSITGDTLFGGEGNDTLIGGANDKAYGDAGNDYLELYAWGQVEGGVGNDTLTGYWGTMTGGEGSDLYLIGSYLFGTTIIDDFAAKDTGVDRAEISFAKEEFVVTLDGNDLMLSRIQDSSQQIHFANWFLGSEYQVDTVSFSGNVTLNAAELTALVTPTYLNATFGDDVLLGTAGADLVYGLGGKDILLGMGGNDQLYGGPDDDTFYGAEGNDYLEGGEGNDTLDGGDGSDYLLGEDGDDVLQGWDGDDALFGESGNDVLYGGIGNDWFAGGIGNDVYWLGNSDPTAVQNDLGNDTIAGVADNFQDVLQLHNIEGLSDAERNGNDLRLDFVNVDQGCIANSITLQSWFNGPEYQIQALTSQQGNTTLSYLLQAGSDGGDYADFGSSNAVLYFGLNGDDTVFGGGSGDVLFGGDGDDALYGGMGGDILVGGSGSNMLVGGEGNDILFADHSSMVAYSSLLASVPGF